MNVQRKLVWGLVFTAFKCFGGFGSSTLLIKTIKEQGNKEILKRSMAFEILYKQNKEIHIPTYPFTNPHFFTNTAQNHPVFKKIDIKKGTSKELIGLMFCEQHSNSFLDLDIICHPHQIFYQGISSLACNPVRALRLKQGSSIVCFDGENIQEKEIKKLYTIYNDNENETFIPQSPEPLWFLVSSYGVVTQTIIDK